jgi:hypothetical protein
MGSTPQKKTTNNVATQLAIIKGAFKESQNSPACCFKYNADSTVECDVIGPLSIDDFMKRCRLCQAKIKETLTRLQTD